MYLKKGVMFLLLLIVMMYAGCSDEIVATEDDVMKDEAMTFSLKVVKSYIEGDSLAFKSFLPDTLYSLEPWEEPLIMDTIPLRLIFPINGYPQYTIDDYKDVYDPKVMDFEQYSKVDTAWFNAFTYWHPDEKDYVFLGALTKEGKTPFMFEDMLAFMITKRSGQWKIRAL